MIATTRLNKRRSKHSLTFPEGTTQDSLLSGVAEAARRLLVIADFDAAVNDALEAIATAAAIDRIFIYQHCEAAQSGREFATCPYEWTQPGVIRTCEIPGQYPMFYDEFDGYTQWVAELKSGQSVQKLAREMSAAGQHKQAQEQALSVLTVPIFIEGTYWGNFGFDDCTTERIWSDAEISVLETAAASFAGALQRRGHQADLETYNHQLRQRDDLLNSVNDAAQCLVAQDDLAQAIPEALRILGEGARQDRVYVFENVYLGRPSEVFWDIPYEWNAPNVIASSAVENELPLPASAFPPGLITPLLEGKSCQFLTRDLDGVSLDVNEKTATKAMIGVPIFVANQWWGVLAFDDCTTERVWTEAEIAVLETAAACLGSAIERDRTRQDREAAAQARAAELEQHNQTLAERDRILEATAAAANVMLTADDFDIAVGRALQIVGHGLAVDRISLAQHFDADNPQTSSYHQFLHEWTSPGTSMQTAHPELVRVSDRGIEFALEMLRKGEIFGGIVEELPEPFLSSQLELGVQSTYAVPIRVDNRFWGIIGLDDCHKLTRRSEAELEALKTLANCIGNAIERDLTIKAREAAEREMIVARERAARAAELEAANQVLTRRDRWLETTATAASELLSATDVSASVETALATIGRNLECDRISVMQHILAPDAPAADLGLMRVLYEWDAEGIRSQCEDLDLREIPSDGVEDWFKRVMAGHWVGGLIGVLKDPFRSSMQALDIQSTYAMPVFVEGKFWGIVTIDHCRDARRLSAAELAVFKTAATCVGSAIYQATVRRDRAAQERAAELAKTNAAISETLSALTATPELNEFLGQILIKISEQIGACKAHLFFYDEETETLCQHIAVQEVQVYQGAAPGDPEMFRHPIPIALSPIAWERIINSSKPFTFDESNPEDADLLWPESLIWHQKEGHRAATCACMKVGQKPIGFIGFAFRHIAVLTDEQLEFIQALTNQATLSIHLTRLAEEAKQTAILQEQEKAAQERAAELAKANLVLKKTIDTLATEPELSRFLGYVLQAIAIQFDSPFLEYWRNGKDDIAYLELVVINGEVLAGEHLLGHHGVEGLIVPSDAINAETLFQRTQHTEYAISPTDGLVGSFYVNLQNWCHSRDVNLPGKAVNFPVILGKKCFGSIAIFLHEDQVLSEENIALGYALTNQAALALQLTRLAEESKQVAISQEQEKAAQERAAELAKTNEAIAKTLTNLAASPELNQFLGTILVEMARQLNACKAHLFLYDQPTHTLTQRIAIQDGQIYLGVGPNDPEMFAHPVPADMTPGWNTIIASERPLTYDETLPFDESIWWPESLAWHKSQGHKAITCIPMKAGETPIGYIGFCFYDRTVLSDEQLEFMQALANQAIVAIQLTTLAEEAKQAAVLQAQEKAAQQRVAELAKTNEALSQTLNVLTTEPELDRFLGKILTQINEQIGADDAHLFLYDPESHTLRQQVAVQSGQVFPFNAPGDPDIFRQPVPADLTQAWQITLNSPKPFVIDQNDPESAAFLWPGTAEWHQSRGHCTAVYACMKVGHQPLGFIGFAFRDCIVLTDEQLEFIQVLTNQATLSVHLARLAEQTQSTALTNERNRLAREIHDTLAQAFTGVSLQLEAAKGVLNRNPDKAQTYVARAGNLARRGLSEARRSVRALRSQALETDTLPRALQIALQEMTQNSPMQGEFNLIGTPLPLSEDLQTNLLRIGQEAITNALRHAQAQQLILTLQFTPEQVRIYITDNGKGCQINAITEVEGFGLLGMRERTLRFGGQFSFKSALGEGTIIDIMIPMEGRG